jgi:DNA-binding beta-propeller fold protein YncE
LVMPAALAVIVLAGVTVDAQLLVTNRYGNTVDLYDPVTLQPMQIGFFDADAFNLQAGLTGITVDHATNNVYVGGQQSGQIYVFNGVTGAPVATTPTGTPGLWADVGDVGAGPARVAFRGGNLWVGDFAGGGVKAYDATTGALVQDLSLLPGANGGPGPAVISSMAFDPSGNLFIGDGVGTVVSKFDGTNLTPFSSAMSGSAVTPSALAFDANGNVYVGNFGFLGPGAVFKHDSTGAIQMPIPFINVDSFMPTPNGPITFPSGAPADMLIDENGNLLIAALGPSSDVGGGPDGALLRFALDGSFLQTSVDLNEQRFAFGGLAFAPDGSIAELPEPATLFGFLISFVAMLAMIWRRGGIRR